MSHGAQLLAMGGTAIPDFATSSWAAPQRGSWRDCSFQYCSATNPAAMAASDLLRFCCSAREAPQDRNRAGVVKIGMPASTLKGKVIATTSPAADHSAA